MPEETCRILESRCFGSHLDHLGIVERMRWAAFRLTGKDNWRPHFSAVRHPAGAECEARKIELAVAAIAAMARTLTG